MTKPLVVGNWKMHTTVVEALSLAKAIRGPLEQIKSISKVICPPFIALVPVSETLKGFDLLLGAQNVHSAPEGAFTGEISSGMLAGICEYVIIGHSERRLQFGEEDIIVNKKLHAAINSGLIPILCIGESLEDRQSGNAQSTVIRQLLTAIEDIKPTSELVVAYEPIWAIGTGQAATAKIAQEMLGLVRTTLDQNSFFDGNAISLLYGGSVNSQNIREFVAEPDIDGALVGSASLQPQEFVDIVRKVEEMRA